MNLGPKTRTSLAVLVPEFTVAPVAALGAIYCASTLSPRLLKSLEGIVCKHIVLPHLEWFESLSGGLQKAHEDYDQKKREQMIARGESVPEKSSPVLSRQERADVIAGVLTKGAIAMTADLAMTRLAHHLLSHSKALNVNIHPAVAYVEAVTHLGGIAIMAGPLARFGENMHYKIAKSLQNTFGISKKKSDDLGTAYPYIVLPGQIAALGSLGLALALNGRGHAL